MDPLTTTFQSLKRAGRAALIPFVIGGDPDLATTGELLLTLQDAGADVIEVGLPFSDPLADGPVIQAGSARALARGATPARVLSAVARVRARLHVPVVALSYWNPILRFGGSEPARAVAAFVQHALASGVSGVIVPDLPVEEAGPLREAARGRLATIFLTAPTSPSARLRMIARASTGFIYYVSVTGTTGVRRALAPTLVDGVRQLRLVTTKPICVGFGISTVAQAARVARVADGVIVGSALVRTIAEARSRADARRRASRFLRRLRLVV